MPQANVFAVRMALLLGEGINKNYNDLSESSMKVLAKRFTQLVEAGLKTAAKKKDGEYEVVMPEFSSWVLDPKFRYDGIKRMYDLVTALEFPTIADKKDEMKDENTDKVIFPTDPSSCIPPAVIAERVMMALHKDNLGDVQGAFEGLVNGGTWPYASEDQKEECARLLRAFGFNVKYSKKAKKEALALSNFKSVMKKEAQSEFQIARLFEQQYGEKALQKLQYMTDHAEAMTPQDKAEYAKLVQMWNDIEHVYASQSRGASKKVNADNPSCPKCGMYNAMLSHLNPNTGEYFKKCRDCGYQPDKKVTQPKKATAEGKKKYCKHHASWHKDEDVEITDDGGECVDCQRNNEKKYAQKIPQVDTPYSGSYADTMKKPFWGDKGVPPSNHPTHTEEDILMKLRRGEDAVVARWESAGGKDFVELIANANGYRDQLKPYSYRARGAGGFLGKFPGRTEALAALEPKLQFMQNDVNKSPMRKVQVKKIQLSKKHTADVLVPPNQNDVEVQIDTTKNEPEAPPAVMDETALVNPDIDANMESFLQSLIQKMEANQETAPLEAESVMEKVGDDPVTNPPASIGDAPAKSDSEGNPLGNVGDPTNSPAALNEPLNPNRIKNYTTTMGKINTYIDLLHAGSKENAENMLVAHARRLSTAAKITPDDAVVRIKANLRNFAEGTQVEQFKESYKNLYAGIPVTAARIGTPGDKTNIGCPHCSKGETVPHEFTADGGAKCLTPNCGSVKYPKGHPSLKGTTAAIGAVEIDHTAYPEKLKSLPTASLYYIIKDAQEALKANPDNPKAGYYQDEINYASMELRKRQNPKTAQTMAIDAPSVLAPQDYPALKVVPQGRKFNIVDDQGNVLSSWNDENLAKHRIQELYQRLHNKVEAPVTAQQVQPNGTGESAGIRPPDVQAPTQPPTPSGGTPLTLDNLQNMKTTLMTQPSTPEIEKLKAGVDASMQTMQQTQVNPAQPGQVAPPVAAPIPSPAQTPAAPPVQASLNLIETAAKKGEFLSVEDVEAVSPQAARKMREVGMSRVKADYLLKRVMPYLSTESEDLS